ncbi:MAG: hypothetical protein BIFFINMI_03621 [Phycisphaerae bacterium]|nr:hypothetical protein [Phycisphaerae bacterium]
METFSVRTTARNELVNIDGAVSAALEAMGAGDGVATIFTPHTTAAITINENADPDVCRDWIEKLCRLVPQRESYYRHNEGNSDSHVKSSLVGCSEQVIVRGGRMVLGTWQSVFFAEFDGPRARQVHVAFTPGG